MEVKRGSKSQAKEVSIARRLAEGEPAKRGEDCNQNQHYRGNGCIRKDRGEGSNNFPSI